MVAVGEMPLEFYSLAVPPHSPVLHNVENRWGKPQFSFPL
jgi:hypothetical protein